LLHLQEKAQRFPVSRLICTRSKSNLPCTFKAVIPLTMPEPLEGGTSLAFRTESVFNVSANAGAGTSCPYSTCPGPFRNPEQHKQCCRNNSTVLPCKDGSESADKMPRVPDLPAGDQGLVISSLDASAVVDNNLSSLLHHGGPALSVCDRTMLPATETKPRPSLARRSIDFSNILDWSENL
jgi:hypothetical protein